MTDGEELRSEILVSFPFTMRGTGRPSQCSSNATSEATSLEFFEVYIRKTYAPFDALILYVLFITPFLKRRMRMTLPTTGHLCSIKVFLGRGTIILSVCVYAISSDYFEKFLEIREKTDILAQCARIYTIIFLRVAAVCCGINRARSFSCLSYGEYGNIRL